MSAGRVKSGFVAVVFAFGVMAPARGQRADAPYPPRSAVDRDGAVRSNVAPPDRPGDGPEQVGFCPGTGDCCVANGTPGCADVTCCLEVCSIDDFCCLTDWDGQCADLAVSVCLPSACSGGGTCPGQGDCCASNGSPGCNDAACCDAVCSADPFCCEMNWDGVCAGMADTLCAGLCSPFDACVDGTGNCCVNNPTGGCSDTSCCTTVCELMPSCCEGSWGPACVALAEANCVCEPPVIAECPVDATGDCCDPVGNGTPGCIDECCCRVVCTLDDFCCVVTWDSTCADEASGGSGGPVLCPGVCTPPAPNCPGVGPCFEAHASPGCDSGACCNSVCDVAPECCTVAWGPACAAIATDVCVCAEPFGAGTMFGSTGNTGATFVTIDPLTGAATTVGPHGAFGPVTDIDCSPSGVIFGATGGGTANLITIDPVGPTETLVGSNGLGVTANTGLEWVGSTLYATVIFSGGGASPSDLVTLDPNTGLAQTVGATGLGPIGGLAYDTVAGIMYGVESGGQSQGRLVTINLNTGAATVVGPTGFADVAALEFDPATGVLYAGIGGGIDPAAGSLIQINPATGAGTLVGATGFPALSGITFCGEPSLGACCDPATGVCEDGITQLDCESVAGVWSDGLSCLDVVCTGPICPGVGDCCDVAGNGTPGCNDAVCCELVCGVDPFCCDFEWDGLCADDAFGLCGCPSCPDTQVTWLEPADGFIDARQPHALNDPSLPLGVAQIQVVAPAASGDAACWTLCESNQNPGLHPGLGPNGIASVGFDLSTGVVTLNLVHPLTPGEVTKVAYASASGATVQVATFIAHPADVNGDGTAAPSDILAVIDALNMVTPLPDSQTDADRSGVAGPEDILRVIDLLNGAAAFEPWLDVVVVDGLACP